MDWMCEERTGLTNWTMANSCPSFSPLMNRKHSSSAWVLLNPKRIQNRMKGVMYFMRIFKTSTLTQPFSPLKTFAQEYNCRFSFKIDECSDWMKKWELVRYRPHFSWRVPPFRGSACSPRNWRSGNVLGPLFGMLGAGWFCHRRQRRASLGSNLGGGSWSKLRPPT